MAYSYGSNVVTTLPGAAAISPNCVERQVSIDVTSSHHGIATSMPLSPMMSVTENTTSVSVDPAYVQWNSNSSMEELSSAELTDFSTSLMDCMPSINSTHTPGGLTREE